MNKRMSKFIALAVMITGMSAIMVQSEVADAGAGLVADRVGGKDRIETSVKISKKAGEKTGEIKTAVLVGYSGEVDALAGTALTKKLNGRMFMTRKEALDKGVLDEINSLGIKDIVILGGHNVISEELEESLKSNFNVKRISGKGRGETAFEIAKEVTGGKVDEVFIARGFGSYADALSIGPVSAALDIPILLTVGDDRVDDEMVYWVKQLGAKKATIIGGLNAVGNSKEDILWGLGMKTERIVGANREETSINIAKKYFKEQDGIIIANGYVSADAVVGGYLATQNKSPIILTPAKVLKEQTYKYLYEVQKPTTILGMYGAVSQEVEKDINLALSGYKMEYETVKAVVPFKVIEKKDSTIEVGIKKVTVKGVNGEKEIKNKVIYIGDKITREKVSERITKAAIDEIVIVGTRPKSTLVKDEKLSIAISSRLNSYQRDSHYQLLHKDGTGQIPIMDNLFNQYALGDISKASYDKTMNSMKWSEEYMGGTSIHFMLSRSYQFKTKETNHNKIANIVFEELAGYGLDYVKASAIYNPKTKEYTVTAVVAELYK